MSETHQEANRRMLAPVVPAGTLQTEEWTATRPVPGTEPPATDPTPTDDDLMGPVLVVDGLN
jgi:hypothetical protein